MSLDCWICNKDLSRMITFSIKNVECCNVRYTTNFINDFIVAGDAVIKQYKIHLSYFNYNYIAIDIFK